MNIMNSNIVNNKKSICIFTTVKFNSFAFDISRCFEDFNVNYIFSGSNRFYRWFTRNAPGNSLSILNLTLEINSILSQRSSKIQPDKFLDIKLSNFEKKYELGLFGKLITADRRFGRGYVRGALCRPDHFSNIIQSKNYPFFMQDFILNLEGLIEKYLKDTKPKIVLFHAIAGAPALLISKICSNLKIPILHFVHTRIGNRYCLDSDPLARLIFIENLFLSKKTYISKKSLDWSKNFIKNSFKPEFKPDYILPGRFLFLKNHLKILFFSFFGFFYYSLIFETFSYKSEQIKRQAYKIFCSIKALYYLFFKSYSSFNYDQKFIYFPLHVDPESSTMVLTPYLTDQLWLIESISKCMPSNYFLVVKEHKPMLGRRPFGYYKKLCSLPRVFLVDPFTDSDLLIQKSSLVCSISGTVILESILRKKAWLLLGDAPFRIIAKPHQWDGNILNLSFFINNAISNPSFSPKKLIRYFSLIHQNSFEMPSYFLWGNYAKISNDEKSVVLKSIIKRIRFTINN